VPPQKKILSEDRPTRIWDPSRRFFQTTGFRGQTHELNLAYGTLLEGFSRTGAVAFREREHLLRRKFFFGRQTHSNPGPFSKIFQMAGFRRQTHELNLAYGTLLEDFSRTGAVASREREHLIRREFFRKIDPRVNFAYGTLLVQMAGFRRQTHETNLAHGTFLEDSSRTGAAASPEREHLLPERRPTPELRLKRASRDPSRRKLFRKTDPRVNLAYGTLLEDVFKGPASEDRPTS
jgi:uncharacterized protein YecT (DUF1311 family)